MTDYDVEYRRCDSACGDPFAEFAEFFAANSAGLSVLDLGCGQGRDALAAARHGHSVYGIDTAASGIAQLRQQAEAEALDLRCDVQDMETFSPDRQYDVVVLDRVLHMLPSEDRRRRMLKRTQRWVAPGGHVLLADTRKNRALVRACFDGNSWETVLSKGDFFFVRRISRAARQAEAADAPSTRR